MGTTRQLATVRRIGLVCLSIFTCLVAIDYISYHSRNRRAMAVISELDGRAGSLLGWPLGKEYRITFARPLSDDELKRLSVLNSLSGRDHVTVAFACDLTASELKTAQRVLTKCIVMQPDVRFRKH